MKTLIVLLLAIMSTPDISQQKPQVGSFMLEEIKTFTEDPLTLYGAHAPVDANSDFLIAVAGKNAYVKLDNKIITLKTFVDSKGKNPGFSSYTDDEYNYLAVVSVQGDIFTLKISLIENQVILKEIQVFQLIH